MMSVYRFEVDVLAMMNEYVKSYSTLATRCGMDACILEYLLSRSLERRSD